MCLDTPCATLWRRTDFLPSSYPQWKVSCQGTSVCFSFFVLGSCLPWAYAGLSDFICASILCLENVFLKSFATFVTKIFSPPLLHRFLSLEGKSMTKASHPGMITSKFLPFCMALCCGSLCGLCMWMQSHLLQEEASVLRAEQGRHLPMGIIICL